MNVGDLVGDVYRVQSRLGDGGLGTLYAALDTSHGRSVVLEVARDRPGSQRDRAGERFRTATDAAPDVRHRGLARILAAGDRFLVLEAFGGQSLEDVLRAEGRLPPRRAVELAQQILEALHAAHRSGALHLRLRPGNVWIDPATDPARAIVLDLGLATQGERDPGSLMLSSQGSSLDSAFMAPEQLMGPAPDASADCYAVAALLYTMLVGAPPFPEKDFMSLSMRILGDSPPDLAAARPEVSSGLAGVVARALAKEPAERFPDLRAFLEALGATAEAQRAHFLPRVVAWEPQPLAIVVRGHDGQYTRYTLTDRALTIGRGAEANVRLPDTTASALHGVIEPTPGGHAVRDLGSVNGTSLNGTSIDGARPLALGDVISIGFTELLYTDRPDSEWPAILAKYPRRGPAVPRAEPVEDLATALARAKPGFMPASRPLPAGVDPRPLLIYMESPAYAVIVTRQSSLAAFWARTAADALAALAERPFAGVVALSATGESGRAAQVIEAARARSADMLTVYHGCDYRLEVSGAVALRCGADLVVVGGVDADELVGFIVAGLRLKRDGKLGAPSQAGYEAVLREACPRSPFWEVGAKLRREGKPAPEHE